MTPETSYREIPLSQGKVALVSAHHFEHLSRHRWYALRNPTTSSFYAVRNSRKSEGPKYRPVYMHREILGLKYGDKRTGDHVDHDTLNNIDDNLRIATQAENSRNQGVRKSNTSGYKGVSRTRTKWQAQIRCNGKRIHLGVFDSAEMAHAAYCTAEATLHGEFRHVSASQILAGRTLGGQPEAESSLQESPTPSSGYLF